MARECGYDGVELHPRYAADLDAVAVVALKAKYNLGIPTLGTGMIAGEDGHLMAREGGGALKPGTCLESPSRLSGARYSIPTRGRGMIALEG